ncbi:protein of unknown function [Collimonas sp. OK607]|uniref:nuclear transport factor 2 family protein n=1 Tax=Collimonas sp. OK607 TaxID=1798194 RepID=UPI0008F24AFE|nr:nuclear transport factor 2 family protein [Collimonas sp. OK607]SFA69432.1 protein of unknown function [Collimonas sp. OK607]
MKPNQHVQHAEILRLLDDYHAAMVTARSDILENLVDSEFTLIHITGYVQPKAEWLSVVRSRDFDYHSIQVDASTLTVEEMSGTVVINGRGVFNATINGLKAPWRLQFTLEFTRQKGQWRLMHAKYGSY